MPDAAMEADVPGHQCTFQHKQSCLWSLGSSTQKEMEGVVILHDSAHRDTVSTPSDKCCVGHKRWLKRQQLSMQPGKSTAKHRMRSCSLMLMASELLLHLLGSLPGPTDRGRCRRWGLTSQGASLKGNTSSAAQVAQAHSDSIG